MWVGVELVRGEVLWSAVQGLGTVVTAIIAYFVYLEARSIRRIEWAFHAAGKWQEFNRFLVEVHAADRWERIRSGQIVEPPIGANDKRVLLMYLNIQMIEYYLIKQRIVPKHAARMMRSELSRFGPYSAFVQPVLDEGGYDPSFRAFVLQSLRKG